MGKIVQEKSKSYNTLAQILKILSGEETSMLRIPEILRLDDFIYFKYTPINSVELTFYFIIQTAIILE